MLRRKHTVRSHLYVKSKNGDFIGKRSRKVIIRGLERKGDRDRGGLAQRVHNVRLEEYFSNLLQHLMTATNNSALCYFKIATREFLTSPHKKLEM